MFGKNIYEKTKTFAANDQIISDGKSKNVRKK